MPAPPAYTGSITRSARPRAPSAPSARWPPRCPAWPAGRCPAGGSPSSFPVGLLGAVLASRLSPAVEAGGGPLTLADAVTARSRLGPSRRVGHRLGALFAVDAGGGGLVTTGFLAYYFSQRYGVSITALGWLFFATAVVQAVSVMLA